MFWFSPLLVQVVGQIQDMISSSAKGVKAARDVMSAPVLTCTKATPMRQIAHLLRQGPCWPKPFDWKIDCGMT
jgi:hypothetical protein